ncbi:hypothetical protein [Streptomyces monomycini]|uniref:hypothetical protein n=1 Tax=Streptomyces monomycini TaxID=371720 RepID=UPI0004AB60D2|nr:hypothetical protein [Streptomyces monomycini]
MSLPRWCRRVVPVCAVAAGGCVLSWAGAATGVTPNVLPAPQVKVSKAEMDCVRYRPSPRQWPTKG